MNIRSKREPTRTTPIFILDGMDFFSEYKYREDEITNTHNLSLVEVCGDKINKQNVATLHSISSSR